MEITKNKPIRLLHLKTSAGIGGAETLLEYWPKYLDKERFEQFVIFAEVGPLVEIMKKSGVGVYCFPEMNGARGFFVIRKLIDIIRKNDIDVIHAHGARVNLWGSLASLYTGVPIISTEHNIDLWRDNGFVFVLIDKFSQKINKYRVGGSPAVCKMLVAQEGMPKEKVVCIENSIEVERFTSPGDAAKIEAQLGIKSDTRIIGTIGRLVEQKGHRYLIEAAKTIVNKFDDVKFLIIGDGPLRKELEALSDSYGLKEKIIFAGQRTDLSDLFAIMDTFILPSLTEGLPLVILLAMAAGLPVIATRVSGVPFVIEDGVDGLLCEPRDAQSLVEKMEVLLSDEMLAHRIGSRGKEKVILKYRAEDMIAKYGKLYKEIVDR